MDISTLLQTALSYLPVNTAGDIVSIVTFLIAAAALATRFWKPPAATSKWAKVYAIVSNIAQAKGWNTNAYQPGAKALMIPVDANRTQEANLLGLDPSSTHPKSPVPPRPAVSTPESTSNA